MPSKTPSEALAALVTQRYPISEEVWGDFWDRLAAKSLHPGEALAVLASLTTRMPGRRVGEHAAELAEGAQPAARPAAAPTVNIVGTGGGPSTFNLSTASAFVAAAMGARVIKTGSRAYASRTGSVDLLDRLGIRPDELLRADRGDARHVRDGLRRAVRVPEGAAACWRGRSCPST